jgi:hypothetical protein
MTADRSQRAAARFRATSVMCLFASMSLVAAFVGGCSKPDSVEVGQTRTLDPSIFNRQLQGAIYAGDLAKMTREVFDAPRAAESFLRVLLSAHYKKGPLIIGCSVDLRILGGDPVERMRGTNLSEMAFRQLFEDPVFVFEGNNWTVECNAFGPDGGMDRWTFAGTFVPETGTNVITKAQFTRVYENADWVWRTDVPPEPNEDSRDTLQGQR